MSIIQVFLLISFYNLLLLTINGEECVNVIQLLDEPSAGMTSSSYQTNLEPIKARLNNKAGWCSSENDTSPWIEAKFSSQYNIKKISIQGYFDHTWKIGAYVNKFDVQYTSKTNLYLETHQQGWFDGPAFANDTANVFFYPSITTSRLRISFKTSDWFKPFHQACLRMELFGCQGYYY